MLSTALITAAILLSQNAAPAQDVGACAWSRLPAADQQSVLSVYEANVGAAMTVLSLHDAVLQAAAQDCAGRSDLPRLWLQGVIGSHVIQLGSARKLQAEKGLDQSRLDHAWTSAPQAARNCTLNNASKPFQVRGPACRDRRAPQAFLTALDLSSSVSADQPAAAQALTYMNAKAQNQIANELIANGPQFGRRR